MTRWTTAALLLLLGCSPQEETPTPAADAPATSPASAPTPRAGAIAALPADSILYVDVRTPQEYAAGHVQGAINIPHDQMEARWPELAAHRDRPLVVYCRTGRRSGLALQVLQAQGFSQAVNGGGLDDLAAQGLPTER